MSCGVGRRCGSDPELLRLWCRLVATALIQPLAWEPSYAAGRALKTQKEKEEEEDTPRKYSCIQSKGRCTQDSGSE